VGGGEMGQSMPQSQQSQQFPPTQLFPPEQQGAPTPGQRPPISFPHATLPANQQPQQTVNVPQPAQNAQQPAQQQPQTPYGLALKPANPPQVTYAGGELTVVANNSSLADILTGIDRLVGAHLEGARPNSERVFGQFGPGSPRAVLDSLLSGSPYDFILVGAIDDPGGVQKILLTPHGNAAVPGTNAANQQPNSSEEEENEAANQPEPEPPQPIVQPNLPSEQVQQQSQSPTQQQVKTPEQLLEELQRMRQQQMQQQGTNPR
jgi:hypothetical protein